MEQLTFEYWHKLSEQIITISSLLGGFSIAIIANLLISDLKTRLFKRIMIAATLAASSLLISVFAFTSIVLKTTEGYPFETTESDLMLPRILGFVFFLLGIFSLIGVIALSGWTKSKKMGIFTTILGIITFVLLIILTS